MKDQSSHFGKITLPSVIIADMYKHSLVVMDDIQTAAPVSEMRNETSVVNEDEILYKHATEKRKEQVNNEREEQNDNITWLGGFSKKILVFVNDEEAVHVGNEELILLTKMLEALELSIADIAVLNTAKHRADYEIIVKKLPAKTILFFGVEPSSTGLPMRFPQFQVQNWNECKYLFCPSLLELNTASTEQKNLKQKSWTALKKIFDK